MFGGEHINTSEVPARVLHTSAAQPVQAAVVTGGADVMPGILDVQKKETPMARLPPSRCANGNLAGRATGKPIRRV